MLLLWRVVRVVQGWVERRSDGYASYMAQMRRLWKAD